MVAAPIAGLSEIAGDYDLFIVDQWGVVHDGETPLPGAIRALQGLREAGRKVVLLSNSSRRVDVGIANLDRIGIGRALYDGLVTSGEEVWEALRARDEPFYAALGRRCFMFTWAGDRGLSEGQDLIHADGIADADFILNAGTTGNPVSEYEDTLREAAARGLPMVCANSDFINMAPDGTVAICPGSVAKRYEELGGTVHWHGKPNRSLYERCFALFPDAKRVVGVGDSLYHDIGGARNAGIDSVFVAGGVHMRELGIRWGGMPAPERLRAVLEAEGQSPDYVIATLRW